MSLIHRHHIVVKDVAGDEVLSHHVTSEGREFGHDDHKQRVADNEGDRTAATSEHTHDGVWEVHDKLTDSTRIVSEDPTAPPREESQVHVVDGNVEVTQ